MSLIARIDALVVALANLIKGRQPLSSVLTDLASRTIGAGATTSIIDRAAGDTRYVTTKNGAFGIRINGGGATITTGSKGTIRVPYAHTLTAWTVLGDQTGSIQIDIKKATLANFPTTATIVASNKPVIAASRKGNGNVTGWTTAGAAGDIYEFVVESVTSIQVAEVTVEFTRA